MSEIIKQKIQFAPESAGIYIMLSKNSEPLYVGKAKNIKNRLEQYLNPINPRIAIMTSLVADVRFITTTSEEEALILEMSNIKSMKPKYNVLLKDDRSFPEIFISTKNNFPMIRKHRGKKIENGDYFGPFASSDDVNKTINIIEKFFQIRTCADNEFKSRIRPCLKYQIKRCTAPCVNKVNQEEYRISINNAIKFLKGKNNDLQQSLSKTMEEYSENLDFDNAIKIRDQIISLSKIQMSDNVTILESDNMDILGVFIANNTICIHVFFIRNGYNCGNKPYFLNINEFEVQEILYQFIHQFYTENNPPDAIIVNYDVNYDINLEHILNTKILKPKDERLLKILEFANNNAENSLKIKFANSESNKKFMENIATIFNLDKLPTRIEVFDNSHIFGKNAIGAMITVTIDGFEKSSYRKYNFDLSVNSMDDYAMMYNMLYRRALKIKEMKNISDKIPDLWLIDGGVGHVGFVKQALKDANIEIPFICISKGVDRNAGNEFFHTKDESHIVINRKSDVMYFLQRIRDEVHRFVITSHRKKRDKDAIKSVLDEISGIGKERKKTLLMHFGSVDLISKATIYDLQKVDGINEKIAEIIYNFFKK